MIYGGLLVATDMEAHHLRGAFAVEALVLCYRYPFLAVQALEKGHDGVNGGLAGLELNCIKARWMCRF